MARATKQYYVTIGNEATGIKVGFTSYSDIYNSVKDTLGIKEVTAATSGYIISGKAGELLPQVAVVLRKSTNEVRPQRLKLFCDPGSVEAALTQIVGKRVKGKDVVRVKIPKRRVFI